MNCIKRWGTDTGKLNGTLPHWSVGLHSHNWAQANVFRWQPSAHTGTLWSDGLGGKALGMFTASLSLSPGRPCSETWGRTYPHPLWQASVGSDVRPHSSETAKTPGAGCQHSRAKLAILLLPRNQMLVEPQCWSHFLFWKQIYFICKVPAKQFIVMSNYLALILFTDILNLLFPRYRFLD